MWISLIQLTVKFLRGCSESIASANLMSKLSSSPRHMLICSSSAILLIVIVSPSCVCLQTSLIMIAICTGGLNLPSLSIISIVTVLQIQELHNFTVYCRFKELPIIEVWSVVNDGLHSVIVIKYTCEYSSVVLYCSNTTKLQVPFTANL